MQTQPEMDGRQAEAMDRLTRLQALTASLSEAVTSEQVADATLTQAVSVLGACAGVVARLSDDGSELVVVHAAETVNAMSRIPADARMPLCDAVRDRQPVLLSNLAERDARYPEVAAVTGVRAEGALAALPLVVRGKAIGGMGLRFPIERTFADEDRAFLLTIAGLCAQALERARLFDTERAARERAEQAETALRAIIDNCPSAIFVKDPQGRYLLANKACEAYAREPAERAVGKTASAYFPRGLADHLAADDRKVLETGEALRYESVMPAQGGTLTALTVKFPLRDDGGRPYAVCGIATDITELKRATEALRASEERFARFMQHLPGLAWIKDAQGQYVYANDTAVKAFRTPREELYGRTDEEVFPSETAAQFQENDRKALAGGAGVRVVETLKHGDGIVHHSLVSKFPIPGPGGEAALVGGMAIDITEEVRTRAVLEESEERLRTLSNNLPHGAIYQVVADPQVGRRFLYISGGVERLFGVTAEEAMADAATLYGLIHEEDGPRVAAAEETALRDLSLYDCEFRSRTSTGEVRWFHCRSAPRRLPSDEVIWEGVILDVTARKNAETDLARLAAESEKRRRLYEAALSNTPDLVYVFDLSHRFTYANEGLLRMWGKTWDEAIGKNCLELGYEPWHAAMHDREIDQVVATKQSIRGEVPFAGTFGRRVYDYIFVPVLGKNGEVEAVAGTTRDVTDRRQAEDRYRTVLESITDAFFAAGRDWRFSYVNRQAEKLLGRTPGDLLGKCLWDEYPGLAGSEFERAYRQVMAERVAASVTAFYPDHDRWYEVYVYPAEEGISVYFQDVTARHRAEAELARLHAESDRLRRLYETALSNSPDYNFMFDLEGRFTYANEALLALWGRSLQEAVGKGPLELGYPPDLAGQLQRQVRQVAQTRQPLRDETPFPTAAGTREYEYNLVPVIGAGEAVEGVVGSAHDITDRKALEGRLRDQAEQLRQADRRKDDFLATLAHELRNPLAPMRNGLQVMKLAGGNAGAVEQARAMIDRQLAVMVRLIDDLLDVSRITRGKLSLRRERVELASVVQNAVEGSRPLIEASAHDLTIALPPEPVVLEADPTRLAQVFSNLLTNAAKYTDKGGRITLSAEREGSQVVVCVRDTGIGIPPEHLPKLFEMFSQVDSALERSQGGLGIGLSLVKGLVRMHGGSVEARSEGRGKGSEFVVLLPVLSQTPDAMTPQPGGGAEATSRKGRRILVADDNRDAANSLAMVLRLEGHDVHTAHDGQEAFEAAAWFRPELALLDIGMPKLNGFEAARRIRGQPWGKNIVLVAITGWGQEEDRRRAMEAGFDLHLTKPVDPADLDKLLAGVDSNPA